MSGRSISLLWCTMKVEGVQIKALWNEDTPEGYLGVMLMASGALKMGPLALFRVPALPCLCSGASTGSTVLRVISGRCPETAGTTFPF